MATSTCVKCKSTKFEAVLQNPQGSSFNFIFIQCAACGGVVGVTEFYNLGARLDKLAKKLNVDLDEK